MRKFTRASFTAVVAAGLICASAAAATAGERGHHPRDNYDQFNVCGNVHQEQYGSLLDGLLGNEQEAEGPVICQNGVENSVDRHTVRFSLLPLDGAPTN
ncbi:hypothetical protein [Streptomyces sp. NPDC048639]|uniref:hypothetical protein n=1 Tax=Streptomyces sp. NPDC048639 TaxID=3365581 RepID=UPI003716566C